MSLKKHIINLTPTRSIDTEADPKQSRGPLTLQNCYVERSGELRRRPGYNVYTTKAYDHGNTFPTVTDLVRCYSLHDMGGIPAVIARVGHALVPANEYAVSCYRWLRYNSESTQWMAAGDAMPLEYTTTPLGVGQIADVSSTANQIVGAALIGDVLCYLETGKRIVFKSLSTDRIVAQFGITNTLNSPQLAKVNNTFFVFGEDGAAGWRILRYDTTGTQLSNTGALGTIIGTLYAWCVVDNGAANSRLHLLDGNTGTGAIRANSFTEAGAQVLTNTTIETAAAGNLQALAMWATTDPNTSYPCHLAYTNNANDLKRTRHAGIGLAKQGATIAVATLPASGWKLYGGGTGDMSSSDGYTRSHLLCSGSDGLTPAHKVTWQFACHDTTTLTGDVMYHVECIGKPVVFAPGGTTDPYQSARVFFPGRFGEHATTNNYYLIGCEVAPTSAKAWVHANILSGHAGLQGDTIQAPLPIPIDTNEFGFVFSRRDRTKTVNQLDPSLSTTTSSPVLLRFKFGSRNLVSYADGKAMVGDGTTVRIFQEQAETLGFLHLPEKPYCVTSGGGTPLAFNVKQLFEYVDRIGDRYQSAASEGKAIVVADNIVPGSANVRMAGYNAERFGTVEPYAFAAKVGFSGGFADWGVALVPFSTEAGATAGTVHYRVPGAVKRNTNPTVMSVADYNPSTSNLPEFLLQDSSPAVVEAVAPPGLRSLIAHGKRLYGISMDDPEELWFTAEKLFGSGWRFSDLFTMRLAEGGACKALASLDDHRIVLKTDSIYVFGGSGPDATGNGDFTSPTRVSTNIGIRDIKSVVSTADGVFFKSKDGFYLLNRSLQLEHIGEPVKAFDTLVCIRGINMPKLRQVRFLHENSNTILVWDYAHKVWSTYDIDLGSSAGNVVDAANVADVFHVCTDKGLVMREDNETTWYDNTTQEGNLGHSAFIYESEWVKLDSLQGYSRIKELQVLGEMQLVEGLTNGGNATLYADIDYDYGDGRIESLTFRQITRMRELLPNWTFRYDGAVAAPTGHLWVLGGDATFGTMTGGKAALVTQTSATARNAKVLRVMPGETLKLNIVSERIGGTSGTATARVRWSTATASPVNVAHNAAVGAAAVTTGTVTVPSGVTRAYIELSCTETGSGTVYVRFGSSTSLEGDFISNIISTTAAPRRIFEWRIQPRKQKCKAIKIKLYSFIDDDADAWPRDLRISSVAILYEAKGTLNKFLNRG